MNPLRELRDGGWACKTAKEHSMMKELLKQFGLSPENAYRSGLCATLGSCSKKVQLAAVKQDGSSIRFIQNPSEAVQLEAVKRNVFSIQFIQNPSEEGQFLVRHVQEE